MELADNVLLEIPLERILSDDDFGGDGGGESGGDYMTGLVGTEVGDKCFTTFDLQRNIQVQRVSVLHQSRNSIPENANAPF